MSRYKIKFMPMDVTVEADASAPEPAHDGRPGSILAIAAANDINIEHACGGVCACSTCHVIVHEGMDSLHAAEDDEEDALDNAPGLTLDSRLACQAVADGSVDLVGEVPSWNRNEVSEEH